MWGSDLHEERGREGEKELPPPSATRAPLALGGHSGHVSPGRAGKNTTTGGTRRGGKRGGERRSDTTAGEEMRGGWGGDGTGGDLRGGAVGYITGATLMWSVCFAPKNMSFAIFAICG